MESHERTPARARGGGRRRHRRRASPLPRQGGLRRPRGGRRRGCAGAVRRVRARCGRARPRAAQARRHGGRAAHARRRRRADPDADRPRRARRARRGPRLRRGRLSRQAVRARRAARPDPRLAAAPPATRQRLPRGRRPAPQPRQPRGLPRRAQARAHGARVRAARAPHAERAHRRIAPGAARRGLGLPPLRRDQHRRRVHLEPAPQAGGRRRAADPAHDARRGLRAEAAVRTRLPVKLKVAVLSAALTFAILCLFAVVVGTVAEQRIVAGFDDDLRASVGELQDRITVQLGQSDRALLAGYAAGDAIVRVVDLNNRTIWTSDRRASLGPPISGVTDIGDLRVTSRELVIPTSPDTETFDTPLDTVTTPVGYVQYAKPERTITRTINRVRLFLAFGVFGGTLLAFLGGLLVAQRAMRPIAGLTRAAREVARTRDPDITLPKPQANDEVSDVAGPVTVHGVADDLHRLAGNLIENALIHTPAGTPVTVSVREEAKKAVLEVADRGPGVQPDMRAHVFERFARGGGDAVPSGGSGLGLAIVRAVTTSHGGSVALSDAAGGGARFVVTLPAEPVTRSDSATSVLVERGLAPETSKE